MAKLKEEMKAQVAARTEKDFSVETEGSLLQRRQALLGRTERAKAFILVCSCVRVCASGVRGFALRQGVLVCPRAAGEGGGRGCFSFCLLCPPREPCLTTPLLLPTRRRLRSG